MRHRREIRSGRWPPSSVNFGYGIRGVSEEIHPKEVAEAACPYCGDAGGADDQPDGSAFDEAGSSIRRPAVGTLGWRRNITATLHLRSGGIRICRFIGLSRRCCADGWKEDRISHYTELLPAVAEHCSKTERRADEAERDSGKNEEGRVHGSSRIGEVYDGVISGITSAMALYAGASEYGGGY